ncbi:MAG: hypothetical protein AAFW74_06185, partial [Pseudomonadota bacterium]
MNARAKSTAPAGKVMLPGKTGELTPQAGGKARALARLHDAGFNPPDFFVILPQAFNTKGLKPAHRK